MRVFVVGASGAIGTRLVPQLIDRGHEVIGTCRSPEKAGQLRALGAEPVVLYALDARAVREAVATPTSGTHAKADPSRARRSARPQSGGSRLGTRQRG
jgi:2-alkyl-3-oxoalkanoate reductase